jgi:hypothetical protein
VPSGSLPLGGDQVRLVQVVFNFPNDAAKFTDADGHLVKPVDIAELKAVLSRWAAGAARQRCIGPAMSAKEC